MSHQWLMTFFTQARCRWACMGYIKNSCQDRWHVQHAVIEWHVVTKSIILHTARVSLEKWHVSPLAQVPDLYESFFFLQQHNWVCRYSARYLCYLTGCYCENQQIWSSFAYCKKSGTHTHSTAEVILYVISLRSSCSICSCIDFNKVYWLKH